MLKFLSQFKPASRSEYKDAKGIYAKIMLQSRNPQFYGDDCVEDSTDGRMEWLSALLSVVLFALQNHGEDGAKLSQAIYDVMVEDFDIALREQGLTDSGVKHRIKPLAKMFLTRAKTYSRALDKGDAELQKELETHVLSGGASGNDVVKQFSRYVMDFSRSLGLKNLDQIAEADFQFPGFTVE